MTSILLPVSRRYFFKKCTTYICIVAVAVAVVVVEAVAVAVVVVVAVASIVPKEEIPGFESKKAVFSKGVNNNVPTID